MTSNHLKHKILLLEETEGKLDFLYNPLGSIYEVLKIKQLDEIVTILQNSEKQTFQLIVIPENAVNIVFTKYLEQITQLDSFLKTIVVCEKETINQTMKTLNSISVYQYIDNTFTLDYILSIIKKTLEVYELEVKLDQKDKMLQHEIKKQEVLQQENKKLKELNQNKNRFFTIIAHELKQPLSSVISGSEFLAKNYQTIDKKQISVFSKAIYETSQKLFSFLIHLLDWVKLQLEGIQLNPKLFSILQIIKNIEHLFSDTIEEKNISIINKVEDTIHAYVDLHSIETVFRNIIGNAIKFTHPNGSIKIEAEIQNSFVLIHIHDDGVGIGREHIDKIFKIEEQYIKLGTNREQGTGMGLILCKEIIMKHGGEISVTSKEGDGSIFSFTLPLDETKFPKI